MSLLSAFGVSGFGGTGGGDISRFWRFCWKTKEVIVRSVHTRSHNIYAHTHTLFFTLTLFSLVTMNFSTLCCLFLNILEPLLLSRESSSSITSLGVLILVPRSNSEASGSDSSSDTKRKEEEEDTMKGLNMEIQVGVCREKVEGRMSWFTLFDTTSCGNVIYYEVKISVILKRKKEKLRRWAILQTCWWKIWIWAKETFWCKFKNILME